MCRIVFVIGVSWGFGRVFVIVFVVDGWNFVVDVCDGYVFDVVWVEIDVVGFGDVVVFIGDIDDLIYVVGFVGAVVD